MKETDIDIKLTSKDLKLNHEKYGKMTIPFSETPAFFIKLEKIKKDVISDLESTLRALSGSLDAPSNSSNKPEVTSDTEKEYSSVDVEDKDAIDGKCFSCDKNLSSNHGTECVICQNKSHKKCLEDGICKTCFAQA